MKKFNVLTLAAILGISIAVLLAAFIATSPIAGGGESGHLPMMATPF